MGRSFHFQWEIYASDCEWLIWLSSIHQHQTSWFCGGSPSQPSSIVLWPWSYRNSSRLQCWNPSGPVHEVADKPQCEEGIVDRHSLRGIASFNLLVLMVHVGFCFERTQMNEVFNAHHLFVALVHGKKGISRGATLGSFSCISKNQQLQVSCYLSSPVAEIGYKRHG